MVFQNYCLYSQIDGDKYYLKFEKHVAYQKYKNNDTIYEVMCFTEKKDTIILRKYIKKSKKRYEYYSEKGNKESGQFRTFLLCNNPFKEFKKMEKFSVWKEYDSNGNLVKTIDYSNVETYDGLGIKKSIRLFPYGRYGYIKRNNMNGMKNKN